MANPVFVEDLEARFRPLAEGQEKETAEALLVDAWAVLLMTIPDLEDRLVAGAVSDEAVTFVVTAMALRVLRNPNGVRSWSVDDYSETRDNSLSAGSLYVSADEVRLLTGLAAVGRGGAFSVTPGRPASPAPGSESEYVEYLRAGSPYGTFRVPPGSW